jgi:hypothetical protein
MNIGVDRFMPEKNFKLIVCNALYPLLLPHIKKDTDVKILDIGLHTSPRRLRERVQGEIENMEEKGVDIHLGYGLCGRGLEGVCSTKSRLILPRIDDCVGALLGSRDRHRKILKKHPGSFFIEPTWLDTEMNIFDGLSQGMEHLSADRRDKIIAIALRHYKTIAMLVTGKPDSRAVRRCERHAEAHALELLQIPTDLTLLERLMRGPQDPASFVITPIDDPIPFF